MCVYYAKARVPSRGTPVGRLAFVLVFALAFHTRVQSRLYSERTSMSSSKSEMSMSANPTVNFTTWTGAAAEPFAPPRPRPPPLPRPRPLPDLTSSISAAGRGGGGSVVGFDRASPLSSSGSESTTGSLGAPPRSVEREVPVFTEGARLVLPFISASTFFRAPIPGGGRPMVPGGGAAGGGLLNDGRGGAFARFFFFAGLATPA